MYERLDLGNFEAARPGVEAYLQASAGYETNRHELTPVQRERVARAWGDVIRRYGYAGA